MHAEQVLALAELDPSVRDAALDRALGLEDPVSSTAPGPDLIGYHASALAPICRMVLDVSLHAADVFVDLGAGRGKVVALVSALTAARTRGIEIQTDLIANRARGVELEPGDVRSAALDDGTVFFLYTPFTGAVLSDVLQRLHAVARRHAIVVCALGFTPECDWLRPRETDAFWLTVLDSVVPGVAPRAHVDVRFDSRLERLAHERR